MCIDTDWVSDSIITNVAEYLITNKIKSTWFITHDSPAIRKLLATPDIFEVGIHPNFSNESTQGTKPKDIMNYLLKIAPLAKSVRTHCLLQSTPLLKMMREEFNILYDTSIFLPNTLNIIPHELYFSKDVKILRFPCFWEDDVESCTPSPSFSFNDKKNHVAGLKIFGFHPIHIVLNSSNFDNYCRCKSKVDITKCSITDLKSYINTTSNGAGTFFKELTQHIKNSPASPGLTISDLAKKWRMLK